MATLKNLRSKINSIDEKVVHYLGERAKVSLAIGALKAHKGASVYAPDREKEVLTRIKKLNSGPMKDEALESIYREVMSSSLALEKSLQIGYLGTEGSFSHLAANKKFGSQVQYISCESIAEVFQKVEHGDCDYGVVPIENSIEGAVTHTFDLFVDSDLKICAQLMVRISHNLLSNAAMKDIRAVYSAPRVFGQCRRWLLQNVPHAELVPVASTTLAAQMVGKQKHAAAIGSTLSATVNNVKILRRNIQDVAHNTTRFLVIGTQDVPPTGKDRTSILFSIKDRVGALHAMLVPFEKNKINLTKIESRPSKKRAWDYYFFVDFEGHAQEEKVKKTLAQLEGMCNYLKILGSYPEAE
jgi:chorismate mutase / prephenate dehydratase